MTLAQSLPLFCDLTTINALRDVVLTVASQTPTHNLHLHNWRGKRQKGHHISLTVSIVLQPAPPGMYVERSYIECQYSSLSCCVVYIYYFLHAIIYCLIFEPEPHLTSCSTVFCSS